MAARLAAVVLAAVAVGGLSALLKPEERGGLTRDEAVTFVREVFEGRDVDCDPGDGGWACAYTYRDVDGKPVRDRGLIDDGPYPVTGNLH